MKSILVMGLMVLLSSRKACNAQVKHNLVPDAATAIRIAEAVCIPIFGADKVGRKKPFTAYLKGDTLWIVKGTLPHSLDTNVKVRGGVPYIEIVKDDGRIIRVYHTQ